jgi:thiosulfate reductase cytochrome b subunit
VHHDIADERAPDIQRPSGALFRTAVEFRQPLAVDARGVTKVFGREFDTTGFLGVSNVDGTPTARGFPPALTIPSEQDLATGRRWHFLFAWLFVATGLVYLAYGVVAGHFRRDLVPKRSELASIGAEVGNHLRLRFPRGDAARRYNTLQMLSYLGVIFLLLPLMVVTGVSMSPGIDAALHWLPEMFGGRQGARTAHFIVALLLSLFVVVHVVMVLISGPLNNLRSMITGWYRLPPERKPE